MARKRKILTKSKNDDYPCKMKKKFVPDSVAMNCLNNLPIELKLLIFRKLDFKDLSILSTISKSFRDIIITHFLLSKESLIKIFEEMSKESSDCHQISSDLGLLVKRATFILPNYKRVQLIISIFKIIDFKNKLRSIYENDKTAFNNIVKAIKSLLTKLIAGWKFREVLKLIDVIELYFNHSELLLIIMTKEFGVMRHDEQYLRYFYRKIIFECFDDNLTRGKWLNYFLNYHTKFTSDENQRITFQSKLLLLLFAPIFQDNNSNFVYIDWFSFTTTIFMEGGLEYLGLVLRLLNSLKCGSKPNVCALFRTITNIALFWLLENSSTLLYHCGMNIIKQTIDYLLKKDNLILLVRYLTNMFIVESKLMVHDTIRPAEMIMGLVYDYLKSLLNLGHFENIMDLISSEFLSMSREIENLADDRDHLDANEIVGGILRFYELRLKKSHLQ